MTLVLLVGSGLLVRSFSRMLDADIGFQPANVLTFRVALPRPSYADAPHVLDFERRLLESLSAIPAWRPPARPRRLPMASGAPGTAFVIDGRPTPAGPAAADHSLQIHVARLRRGDGDAAAAGTHVRQSRSQGRRSRTSSSTRSSPTSSGPASIRSANACVPAATPRDAWYTVVGVVSSERQDGFRQEPPVLIYFGLGSPYRRWHARTLAYVLTRPARHGESGRRARGRLGARSADLPVAVVQTMDEVVVAVDRAVHVHDAHAGHRRGHGAAARHDRPLWRAVVHRSRCACARSACVWRSARSRRGSMRSIVGQGVAIVGVGLVVGLAGAYGLTRLLADLLYDTQPLDVGHLRRDRRRFVGGGHPGVVSAGPSRRVGEPHRIFTRGMTRAGGRWRRTTCRGVTAGPALCWQIDRPARSVA